MVGTDAYLDKMSNFIEQFVSTTRLKFELGILWFKRGSCNTWTTPKKSIKI